MKGFSRVLVAIMVALSMAWLCSAQDIENDTIYKIIQGPMIRADQSCWVDVHKVIEDGKAGELLGYSRVGPGIHEHVPILIRDRDPGSQIEEDEYKNCGVEHSDVPEYPYLAEEEGAFELKGLHFDNN